MSSLRPTYIIAPYSLGSSNDDNETKDLESLEKDQLHPWQFWRGLVLTHACQCALPLAVCAVPHCAAARKHIFEKEDLRTGKRLALIPAQVEAWQCVRIQVHALHEFVNSG